MFISEFLSYQRDSQLNSRPIIQKKFCQETPARNRPEKLERAKNIFWEYWLKNFLSYFLGTSNSLAHDDDDNDDKNHDKI